MRRILVGIKRVIDYNVRASVKSDGSGIVTEGIKFSVNPFDEIAVEEAVRLKQKGACDEVVVATVGPAVCLDQLRNSLARGADRALLVETTATPEPPIVARVFLKLVEKESPRLVLLGKQAVDEDNGQTPQMLAALWGRPQATFASKIEIGDDTAQVTREVDAGLETIDVDLPAVVSTDLRLNEPHWLTLPEIMKAKSKPVETLTLESLGIEPLSQVKAIRYDPPVPRQKGVKVASAQELVGVLRQKGVI